MKYLIAVIALFSGLANAADRIDQSAYPQFERFLLLNTCANVHMATAERVIDAYHDMHRVDMDAVRAYQRGSAKTLEYIGPDNAAQLMYMVEGIVYSSPSNAAMICGQL